MSDQQRTNAALLTFFCAAVDKLLEIHLADRSPPRTRTFRLNHSHHPTMATVAAVPKAQASRKGKKAWRKNVDVSEVTTGLDQVRTEIIQGGIITEKSDAELFAVDTTGSTNIRQKQLREAKPLKVDEILNARSAVPALINPKKRAGPSGIELGDGVVPAKKHRKNGVSYKDLARLRRIAYGGEAAKDGVKTSKATQGKQELYDPWGDAVPDAEDTAAKLNELDLSFVEKPKPLNAPETLKHGPVGIVREGEEAVPAVRLPDPGISYNPEFDKWDSLLTREGDKEVELEKKRLQLEAEEKRILELAEIEDPEEEEEEEDESESESEGEDPEAMKKMPQRKTPAQRNKVKRRKEAERLLKHKIKNEVHRQQLESLKQLRKTLDLTVTEKAVAKRKALTPAKRLIRRRKFDRDILPPAPLELQLPEELTDSLRRLKPEGNLLRDRYRNLRERGVIETRVARERKKAKRTLTEKWSYKDWKP
ncbi:Ribosome biogenesis protein NOP53 [Drechslerella dactyloides]|uniref:Ribosome biogenesis protein NOP53 n=1 Tax=Drechslerella dactyloides TaxID=74499 RepID=A0AAD6J0A1_DREDA|nr:Ribosome biogenesis protein NOP53 [Drechslerella dactyloides]